MFNDANQLSNVGEASGFLSLLGLKIAEEKNVPNGYFFAFVLIYSQSTSSTWVKSVLLFVKSCIRSPSLTS